VDGVVVAATVDGAALAAAWLGVGLEVDPPQAPTTRANATIRTPGRTGRANMSSSSSFV
jgi:hypothetical protein